MEKASKTRKTSLFNSIDELKEFFEWSKKCGIQSAKIGDIEVTFSALAMLPEESLKELTNGGASTLAETEPENKEEQEDLLYFSSN